MHQCYFARCAPNCLSVNMPLTRVIPCQINQWLVTSPISMKFGTLADNAFKKIGANCLQCRSSGFRVMTFKKMEKGSFFATKPVSQISITFFLLAVGSSMMALFKALIYGSKIAIIDYYKKSQKPKSFVFFETLTLNKKKRPPSQKFISG